LWKVWFVTQHRSQFLAAYAGNWFITEFERRFLDRFYLFTGKPLFFMREPKFLPTGSCGLLPKLLQIHMHVNYSGGMKLDLALMSDR
jgi:hypothetical protein